MAKEFEVYNVEIKRVRNGFLVRPEILGRVSVRATFIAPTLDEALAMARVEFEKKG